MSQPAISLNSFNTFALAANCQQLIIAKTRAELIAACRQHQHDDVPPLVLGGGSNILLLEDFEGTVIKVENHGIELQQTESSYLLAVEAGETWHELVCYCLRYQIPGLENLALIPGTVGAAPIQNIGAYGVEFADVCDWVEYFDMAKQQVIRLSAAQCQFGYRDSVFKQQLLDKALILGVGLRLPKHPQPKLSYGPLQQLPADASSQMIFDCVCATRREKIPDPTRLGNVGSCFKNPIIAADEYARLLGEFPEIVGYPLATGETKIAAAWLIDKAGLKGACYGDVMVHPGQPLVLVNRGNASGQDVVLALQSVRSKVYQIFGITLEPEPRTYAATGEKRI
ncbi:UDP-N-acetylmuramate dehydrogenase [Shewanella sp. A32]|uniref:UDP-N-acetylmuramate dehydrogenase n=1 Tax=Shewanella sp. A32 TaxID=3031327 RepID=UPI0023BA15C7|nr:UDP-N-acetylmuramate dehydrogenase [Shewanella sp. A32]MDF0535965.1 UDP-N-acetylmuramate dehydrogenase [Shewanella sp. A32]